MTTLAYAEVPAAPQPQKPPPSFMNFVPIIGMLAIFYLFMIRPQRQRQRKQTELMQDLQIGDEVQTAAGMFGKIVQLSDEFAWVELAPGTTIKMLRRAVIGKVGPIEEAEPGTAE